MPKAKKTKVQSVVDPLQHTHIDGSAHSHEGGDVSHSHESVPMSKEEFCKEYGIARPGSNHAETEYNNYLLDKFI